MNPEGADSDTSAAPAASTETKSKDTATKTPEAKTDVADAFNDLFNN